MFEIWDRPVFCVIYGAAVDRSKIYRVNSSESDFREKGFFMKHFCEYLYLSLELSLDSYREEESFRGMTVEKY